LRYDHTGTSVGVGWYGSMLCVEKDLNEIISLPFW